MEIDFEIIFKKWEEYNNELALSNTEITYIRAINPFELDNSIKENPFKKSYSRFINNYVKNEKLVGLNMSINEAAILYMYALGDNGRLHEDINNGLRKEKPYLQVYKNYLNYVLYKMPSYNNKLYRYVDIKDESEEEGHIKLLLSKKGKKHTFNEFISCHYDNRKIVDNCIYYFIQTLEKKSRAKNISNLPFVNQTEREVVYMAETSFIVDEVNMQSKEVYLIETA